MKILRRRFVQQSAALALGGQPAGAAALQRNVLFIVADQHQAACAHYEGHPQAITPNLDRLAARAVRFTHAYTQNPICTPSRMSMLSGQYPHNHGYYGLGGPPLQKQLPSFLLHYQRAGYRTAAIGKIHTPENWLEPHCHVFNEYKEYMAYLTRRER